MEIQSQLDTTTSKLVSDKAAYIKRIQEIDKENAANKQDAVERQSELLAAENEIKELNEA